MHSIQKQTQYPLLIGVCLVVFLVLMLPFFGLQDQVYLPVTDNLDSNLAWWKSLKDQGAIWSGWNDSVNGLLVQSPRFTYPSGWNLDGLLYFLFSPWMAYGFQKAVIFWAALFSFLFWLDIQGLKQSRFQKIAFSLIWASLAYYPHRGISIAALPAIVAVFQLIFQGKWKWYFIPIVILYALGSKLVLAGFYFWIGLLVYTIWKRFRLRKVNLWPFILLLILAVVWGIQEMVLIKGLFFNPDFHSQREDFTYDFGIWYGQMPWDFLWNGDQNGVFYSPIYLFFLAALVFFVFRKFKKVDFIDQAGWTYFFLAIGLAISLSIISFFGGLPFLKFLNPVLASFNWFRFEYWIPFFLFSSMVFFWSRFGFRGVSWLAPLAIFMNIFIYQYEWRYWLNDSLSILPRVPTYQSYYAENQFDHIKKELGEDFKNYRFAHLNFPPAVSAYNGMTTLDGYMQVYERDHKMEVYQVIQKELEKDPYLEQHFLQWGNKCYFQNAQYPDDFVMFKWREEAPLRNPSFDFSFLKNTMKADFILSSLPVDSDNLTLRKKIVDPGSAWDLYWYELVESD